ncbi:hypothetical protein [Spiroplasma endosymbiont of Aspidapion aeneum]|uniref:hypothetical protein n=1 Tax=Spiroplasma endosymbiont of Aspidapion aeneum TaxID=3066276 RepID=UPI00313AEDEA
MKKILKYFGALSLITIPIKGTVSCGIDNINMPNPFDKDKTLFIKKTMLQSDENNQNYIFISPYWMGSIFRTDSANCKTSDDNIKVDVVYDDNRPLRMSYFQDEVSGSIECCYFELKVVFTQKINSNKKQSEITTKFEYESNDNTQKKQIVKEIKIRLNYSKFK